MDGRTEIELIQLERLRCLLGQVRETNPFYKERLEAAGLDAGVADIGTFCSSMPFTTKADLVADRGANPPFGTNLTFPIEDYSRYCQSSGTAGGPLPALDTNESWSAMLDCWDCVYDAAGVGKGDRIYFAFSFGPFLGFWTAFDAAARRGNLCLPGGGLSSAARLETMRAQGATVLCCTPTYAMRLGEVMRNELKASPDEFQIRTIIVAGEPGGSIPETRKKIESAWGGARVFDHHGMTEVGPVTFEHPDKPLFLCVIEEAYLAEVIDPETGREVGEGERGELVLTTLTRAACPLLRFRTGDLVRKSFVSPAPGRRGPGLAFEGGILGRVDEMVVVRGVNLYPTAIEEVVRGFSEIIEYQVVQSSKDTMAELEVVIEPREELSDAGGLANSLERALTNAFALRIPVSVVEAGTLPRFEFKAKRWIRK